MCPTSHTAEENGGETDVMEVTENDDSPPAETENGRGVSLIKDYLYRNTAPNSSEFEE